MSDFVSIISPPLADPENPPVVEPVAADGWFPEVDLVELRKAVRIDDTVTEFRLRYAVRAAMRTVMNDLLDWQGDQIFAGHEKLEDVPVATIDNESIHVLAWHRAVACYTKAELIERYRDYDTTAAGEKDVEKLDASIGELRRDGAHAVRDILGRGRTTVELI